MMRGILERARSPGLPPLLRRTVGKILTPRLRCYHRFASDFTGRVGLEVGGPSHMFRRRGLFPVYSRAARIDNCTFRPETLWNNAVTSRFRYHWRRPAGAQVFAEATDLTPVPSESYDFLLSCHMLEHSANPLKALAEWQRTLKRGGLLLLALPHKDGTFDHRRPVTPLEHLLEDYRSGTGEDDLTHLAEILELHDLARDPDAGAIEHFMVRSRDNFENRALHHHVFDTRLAAETVSAARFQLLAIEAVLPTHIVILARKPAAAAIDNEPFLRARAAHFETSPFPSDRPLERI